ncbi:MAG: DUF1439 domain-containing protein [Candidatus Obscuribacterales bacterium]|nr:DUF1439 domain-containing protein [Candidatus Obscuribacterales bacterium]
MSIRSYSLFFVLALFCSTRVTTLAADLASDNLEVKSAEQTGQTPAGSAENKSALPESAKSKGGKTKERRVATAPQAVPFKIGSKFSRTLQTVTGINFVTEIVASRVAKSQIEKKTGGKVKVKVKTFSLTDLAAGKVKSVDVQVLDPRVKGSPLQAGDLRLTSDSPFWYEYRKGKDRKRGMQTPVLMTVKAEMSESQIEKALNTPEISRTLKGLKLDLPGLGEQSLQVLKPKVDLRDDSITLDAVLVVEGAAIETGVPVKISAKPRLVEDKRIFLDDLKVDAEGLVEPEKFSAFAQTLLNPLIDFSKLDRRDHAFRLNTLKIEGDEMVGSGKLLLAPQP